MKHAHGPHNAPSERAHHPNGRNNAPSKRAPLLRRQKTRPRNAGCSKRAGAMPSQSKHAPSGTPTRQSHSEIAPNGTKGCVSPNGAMHAMGRRDAPSKRKRHDAGRRGVSAVLRGVSAANGACFRGQRAGSPVLTPQPSLAATKHPRTKPHAQQTNPRAQQGNRASKQNRAPSKETNGTPEPTSGSPVLTPQPYLAATKRGGTNPRPQRNKRRAANNRRVPCVNAAAVLGCAQMRSKNAPHHPTQPNQPQNESQR